MITDATNNKCKIIITAVRTTKRKKARNKRHLSNEIIWWIFNWIRFWAIGWNALKLKKESQQLVCALNIHLISVIMYRYTHCTMYSDNICLEVFINLFDMYSTLVNICFSFFVPPTFNTWINLNCLLSIH